MVIFESSYLDELRLIRCSSRTVHVNLRVCSLFPPNSPLFFLKNSEDFPHLIHFRTETPHIELEIHLILLDR